MKRWLPTDALVRACVLTVAAAVAAILAGRPDLLVLAVPLAVPALFAMLGRPGGVPHDQTTLDHPVVGEGQATTVRFDVDSAETELAAVALRSRRYVGMLPASGVAGAAPDKEGRATVTLGVVGRRWGRHVVADGNLKLTSAWAGFGWGPSPLGSRVLLTAPKAGRFASRAPAPHPIGLVGGHPARRPGSGNEFEGIRPFQPGDRVRRVHWRVSQRTGRLHVTSMLAEEDASVVILLDNGTEVGEPPQSSLDTAVRAAAALAEFHLRRGDRVGLRVLGSRSGQVPVSTGSRHYHRVLDALARVVPGEATVADPSRLRLAVPAGATAVMLSPMLSDLAIGVTTQLARRGVTVVVADTLPGDFRPSEPAAALAWRMRLLEREGLLAQVRRTGIPVVPWRGPGTLDEVLRELARRASRPRLVAR